MTTTNDKPTVRFSYAATNGETTRVRDFDGSETITVNTAKLHELYADVARLERQVQLASSHDQILALRGVVEMAVAEFERIGHTPVLIMSSASAALLSSENKYCDSNGGPILRTVTGEDVARLERQVEIAAAIVREVGHLVSPRLLAEWREAGR